MNPHLTTLPRTLLPLLACLSLASCKENQEIQKQLDTANAQVQSLQKELAQMDAKMAEHRKTIPAYAGTGEAGAKQYAVQLASELVAAENEAARLQTAIQAAETVLSESQKSYDLVKSKDPR
jgi:chromosome segregation ATPase